MGDGVAADGAEAGVHHFFDLGPTEGAATDVDVLFVEVDGEGEAVFFEDGPSVFVDALPAVIHGDDEGFFGDVFGAFFPGEDVVEGDDGDVGVFDELHLFAELGLADDHRFAAAFFEVVVTEDGDDGGFVEFEGFGFGDFGWGVGGIEECVVVERGVDLFFFLGEGRFGSGCGSLLTGCCEAIELLLDAIATGSGEWKDEEERCEEAAGRRGENGGGIQHGRRGIHKGGRRWHQQAFRWRERSSASIHEG